MILIKRFTQFALRSRLLDSQHQVFTKSYTNGCPILIKVNVHSNELFNNIVPSTQIFTKLLRNLATNGSQSKVDEVLADDHNNIAALFPDIVEELTVYLNTFCIPESVNWFKRALEYNVPKGKKIRSNLLVNTYKSLAKNSTPINMRLAHILGWCLELHQSFLLLLDDIVDNSTTRRKQLCWHKVNDVGLIAINDALLLEQCVYYLLKKHFFDLNCYMDLVHVFHDVTFITVCGQINDVLSATRNVETYNLKNYESIAQHKSAYYTSYMPVIAAMHLAGYENRKLMDEIKDILLEVGILFQIQDDFIDCFGDEKVIGKIGTDITENKCSWLAVQCMHRANNNQKSIMAECYGSSDPIKIAQVKQLYIDLNLPRIYADYERKTMQKIKQSLQQISDNRLKEALSNTMDAFFSKKTVDLP